METCKNLGEGKEITKAETPQYLQPSRLRRGWSKVREQAGEKAGVLWVLLEEGNKNEGENLSRCTHNEFAFLFQFKKKPWFITFKSLKESHWFKFSGVKNRIYSPFLQTVLEDQVHHCPPGGEGRLRKH